MTPEVELLYARLEGLVSDATISLSEWQMAMAMHRFESTRHPALPRREGQSYPDMVREWQQRRVVLRESGHLTTPPQGS